MGMKPRSRENAGAHATITIRGASYSLSQRWFFHRHGEALNLRLPACADDLDEDGILTGESGCGTVECDKGRHFDGQALLEVCRAHAALLDGDGAVRRRLFQAHGRQLPRGAVRQDARVYRDADIAPGRAPCLAL